MHPRHVLLVAVGACFALALPISPASAHANYRGSEPSDGETVESPPSQVTAEFSEPLEPESHMEVYDPCGARVDSGTTTVTGYNMSVSMASDTAGRYTVTWTAASAIDPHVTNGSFSFTARSGTRCAGQATSEEEPSGGTEDEQEAGSPNDRTGPSTDGTAEGAVVQGSSDAPGKHDRHANHRMGGKKERGTRARARASRAPDPARRQVTLAAADPLAEGIPMGGLLASFALAALIGATGGFVYAGILGPREG